MLNTNVNAGRQDGAALLVALIILLIMSVVGIAALSSSTTQQRVTNNVQEVNESFMAAQSAVNALMANGNAESDLVATHVLYRIRGAASASNYASQSRSNALSQCTSSSGALSDSCSTNYANGLKSESVTYYRGKSDPKVCYGIDISSGKQSGTQTCCLQYDIIGHGWRDTDGDGTPEPAVAGLDYTLTDGGSEIVDSVQQTVTQVSVCAN